MDIKNTADVDRAPERQSAALPRRRAHETGCARRNDCSYDDACRIDGGGRECRWGGRCSSRVRIALSDKAASGRTGRRAGCSRGCDMGYDMMRVYGGNGKRGWSKDSLRPDCLRAKGLGGDEGGVTEDHYCTVEVK